MENIDYYSVLGVDNKATAKQIKEAYRTLAFEYHPDRNKENPESVEKMKQINEAYAVLSNDKKRREYDAMRLQFGASAAGRFRQNYTEQDIFKGSDVQQVFEEVAKAFGLRGVDEIFKDFYGPGYRSFSVKRSGFLFSGFMFTGGPGKGRMSLPFGNTLGKLPRMMMKQLFGHAMEAGFQIAQEVDGSGRAICLTTTREHAELKQDQVHAFGRDRLIPRCKGSMSCSIEPER